MTKKEKKKEKLSKEATLNLFCEEALKDPHTRIEYIKRGKKIPEKRGVMISCKHPTIENHVIIGFSLCYLQWDWFDRDFGKEIAFKRAMKYSDFTRFIVYSFEIDEKKKDTVYIPQTVDERLQAFVEAAYKYYKDASFPAWIVNAYPPKS
jgi:hypothetical protein